MLAHAGVSYGEIAAILAALAAANWAAFDRTPQGLLLATVCGLGAPVSELVLMKLFGVWHYDRPGGQRFVPVLLYCSSSLLCLHRMRLTRPIYAQICWWPVWASHPGLLAATSSTRPGWLQVHGCCGNGCEMCRWSGMGVNCLQS